MFDFDVGKLLIFGIVALAVIPPKDLPRVMRVVGQYVGKMRRMAGDFQGQFMQAMREAELDGVKTQFDDVKKEFDSIKSVAKNHAFDPAMAMRNELSQALEPVKTPIVETTPLGPHAEPAPVVAEAPADSAKTATN